VTRAEEVVAELRALADPTQLEGMARFGIRTDRALGGIGLTQLRAVAKRLRPDHELALALWDTGVHEARLVAIFTDDPAAVTVAQMDAWVADVDSWDLCDGCCTMLFDRTPLAVDRIHAWAGAEPEFVKRSAFATIAGLAWHDRTADDASFRQFFPLIEREAWDDRRYVWKGVNWALRQIGKRGHVLNAEAIACAERVQAQDTRSARWIAGDALRELRSEDTAAILDRAESRRAKHRGEPRQVTRRSTGAGR
jgi:3-methyladenine DNA glycosylase AlkD